LPGQLPARWPSKGNKMKKFLITIIVLSWLGLLSSAVNFVSHGTQQISEVLILITILVTVNFLSSRYLFNKAVENKVEWALFGFLGNITAIIFFWSFKDVLSNWKQGKRYFS
jgi:peptidoglycan/LPS O-acetylase OafA/YrhL